VKTFSLSNAQIQKHLVIFFSCKKGDKRMVLIRSRLPPRSAEGLCSDGQLSKSESFRRNVLAASGLPLGR